MSEEKSLPASRAGSTNRGAERIASYTDVIPGDLIVPLLPVCYEFRKLRKSVWRSIRVRVKTFRKGESRRHCV
jgi:hypothetical protein